MSETITCIFCTNEREATDEHIVPEFAGGSLIIKEVCKICNSRMGSDFEGPISRSIIFRLPRHVHGIQGKSASPIHPFPNMGMTEDGSKMRVDSEFKPYIATKMEERKLESGGVEVSLKIDASDAEKIPEIIESKIRRTAKKEWPDMTSDEVDSLVRNALASLPQKYEVRTAQPTIGYRESVDLNHLTLLMMKIAYEIAFHHNGTGILADTSNIQLRDAIQTRDTKAKIHGTLFPQPDPFSYVTAPENTHCVALCNNVCYVRLFNISAIIQVSEACSKFSLTEEKWVIYWFDFANQQWSKENFLGYVSNTIV